MPAAGTQFTRFTGTKVQILTQKVLCIGRAHLPAADQARVIPHERTQRVAEGLPNRAVLSLLFYRYTSANADAEGAAAPRPRTAAAPFSLRCPLTSCSMAASSSSVRQYLYFCISNASNVSTCLRHRCRLPKPPRQQRLLAWRGTLVQRT